MQRLLRVQGKLAEWILRVSLFLYYLVTMLYALVLIIFVHYKNSDRIHVEWEVGIYNSRIIVIVHLDINICIYIQYFMFIQYSVLQISQSQITTKMLYICKQQSILLKKKVNYETSSI